MNPFQKFLDDKFNGLYPADLMTLSDPETSKVAVTGKSLSEALILAATNPKYDKKLFIELRVQYMKTTSKEHVVYTNCFLFLY